MKTWSIVLGILVALALGGVIVLGIDRIKQRADPSAYQVLLDSIKADLKVLKDQQAGYDIMKADIRKDLQALSEQRQQIDRRIVLLNSQIKTIESEYAKIPKLYRGISADSTRVLFERAFGN